MTTNELGEHYTKNYTTILHNLNIPTQEHIIEPFVGDEHLLKTLSDASIVEKYDIQSKKYYRDVFKNPPSYKNKFVLTNPPYLSRNKATNKEPFDLYSENDLYKCFIRQLIHDQPFGGIVIIPLNFWSSCRSNDVQLRKEFLKLFTIIQVNVFEEKMFEETSYTVCSMEFWKDHATNEKKQNIQFTFYPENIKKHFSLSQENNWTIGYEIYNIHYSTKWSVNRLIKGKNSPNTFICAQCIDNSKDDKIKLQMCNELYYDTTKNKTARSYATLVINPEIDKETQEKLVARFNEWFEYKRNEYKSLFLTNYRENYRKRIEFSLLYKLVKSFLDEILV